MSLTYRTLRGPDVTTALDDLAQMRITVFRDWPYLYDGSLAYERSYLASYVDNPRAVLVAAFDGDRLVGASTGSPLLDHADDFAKAFATSELSFDQVFYCAESVLLAPYRGQGAGHRFFDARESHARDLGYATSAFCSVIRPDNHPLRPKDTRSHDTFWRGRGYAPLPGVVAEFNWKDVDQAQSTQKRLQFWGKAL
ncbi:GNAT family N-acetyltransferase [Celeribacter baekdonensis]|uniref:GNAT family N-acetyltransferase n=1 Tax=Celeribacter baekdonensis TaxID=875171 RepID=UPI0030DBC23D|tara:strand:- start:3952 stop:4539 length:588 start_codon:yes stop_codon:yes gene_type:complete